MRHITRTILPLATAGFLAFGGIAMAKTVDLSGKFVTEGTAKTTPSGMVKATLDTTTDELKYTITYSGLSGPVKAAHFHGPAPMGTEAGVLVPIKGPYASGMSGEAKVTPTIAKNILDGMTYVNLHTTANPMGEARAQITETPKS
jgi:hypothetical protein